MYSVMQAPLKCSSATVYVLHTGGLCEVLKDLSKALTTRVSNC